MECEEEEEEAREPCVPRDLGAPAEPEVERHNVTRAVQVVVSCVCGGKAPRQASPESGG